MTALALEVVPEGIRVLDATGMRFGFKVDGHSFGWSCETYLTSGAMMPTDGLNQLHIGILTAHFVRHPDWFDVVVGSNLCGDIFCRTSDRPLRAPSASLLRQISMPKASIRPCSNRSTVLRLISEAKASPTPFDRSGRVRSC